VDETALTNGNEIIKYKMTYSLLIIKRYENMKRDNTVTPK
jgi:hypothetical protein